MSALVATTAAAATGVAVALVGIPLSVGYVGALAVEFFAAGVLAKYVPTWLKHKLQ
jgi:hypothetical protein